MLTDIAILPALSTYVKLNIRAISPMPSGTARLPELPCILDTTHPYLKAPANQANQPSTKQTNKETHNHHRSLSLNKEAEIILRPHVLEII